MKLRFSLHAGILIALSVAAGRTANADGFDPGKNGIHHFQILDTNDHALEGTPLR